MSLALAAILAATGLAAAAQTPDPVHPRILILYENESALPAVQQFAGGLEAGLARALPEGFELYSEHLDTVRFPAAEHRRNLAVTLSAKYRDAPPDVVMTVGPGALVFWADDLPDLRGVPLVFGAVRRETAEAQTLPADARGVVSAFDLAKTVDLARRLQPQARRLVVVSGSSDFDRSWEKTAREDFAGGLPGLDISHVSGLSLEGFRAMARDLDTDTILLALTIFEDAEGRKFLPRDAIAEIDAASAAPIYSVYSSYIGSGVVGGHMQTFASIGEAMASLAAQALSGDPGPAAVAPPGRPVVDWREIRRWGIDPALVPPDAERLFYDPTAWERHRAEILIAATVILLQAATIAALIAQHRRRRRVAEERAVEQLELAHLSRASQLGELSGALAHELNQPLTAILANAEAGSQLLANRSPDLAELGEILADIAEDDRRAAGIIAQLRRLMIRGDAQLETVDLNQVVAATVALARSELVARQTVVETPGGQPDLPVRGNLPQLQQIVLNLVLNAAEAMAALPVPERRITIETRARPEDGARELAVSDRGPGLAPELRDRAFRPFVTTKPNGLGFGLSICRSIAQAHGGTLAFDPAAAGARVVLTLPRA